MALSTAQEQNLLETPDQTQHIGEIGEISNLDQTQTIHLNNTYDNPVVFALTLSSNGIDPAIARITDLQDDSFTLKIQEPRYKDQWHTKESISYLVLEAGSWELDDGTILEVGTVDTNSITMGEWESIDFQNDFQQMPAILSQVQTYNGKQLTRTRQMSANADGFEVALEEEEALLNTGHETETVGWLAIEPGSGDWNGLDYEAGHTGMNVDHTWSEIEFDQSFEREPGFFASISSYAGQDSAGLRYHNLGTSDVQIKIEEDQSLDRETLHNLEMVDFLAIAGSGNLTASAYEPMSDF